MVSHSLSSYGLHPTTPPSQNITGMEYGATLHPELNMYYGTCWTPQQQCNYDFVRKWHRSNVKHTNNFQLNIVQTINVYQAQDKPEIIVLNAQQVYIGTLTGQCPIATNWHI